MVRTLNPGDVEGIITWSLVRAARRSERRLAEVLLPHGLTLQQFGVLAQLAVGPPTTQAELARIVLVRPQSASALIDGMAERGLIRRTGDRGRGRSNPLVLTPAGEQLLDTVWEPVATTNDLSDAGIDVADAALLNDRLHRLIRADGPDHRSA